MLATWLRDTYRRADAADLQRAIDDLAAPTDSFYFASNGVYVFFDPHTLEVLYIGLARDLAVRFGQHNGIIQMSKDGCKREQIAAWFESNDELGHAIFVASSVAQVSAGRQKGTMAEAYWDEESNNFFDYPEEGLDEIRRAEGILISAYVARHNKLPPWNKIGGAKTKPHLVTPGGYALLDTATGKVDSLLVARRTIRGLSADVTAAAHEMNLHTGRIGSIQDTFGTGISSPQIWNSLVSRATDPTWDPTGHEALLEATKRLIRTRYPLELPPAPAWKDTSGRLRHFPGEDAPDEEDDDSQDEHWSLMWTDAGVTLLKQAEQVKLYCRACAKPATLAHDVGDGSPPVFWCSTHAGQHGAPPDLIQRAWS